MLLYNTKNEETSWLIFHFKGWEGGSNEWNIFNKTILQKIKISFLEEIFIDFSFSA